MTGTQGVGRPAIGIAAGMLATVVAASDFCLVPAPRECRATGGRYTIEVRRATDAEHFYDYDLTAAGLAAAKVTEVVDASLPAEGYRLSVTTGGVTIAAADAAGQFYARETLRQLAVETTTNLVTIPGCEIRDWPAYRWRGMMIDEARYFLGKTAVLRILDQMARHKLNIFHWHLTDDQGWRLELPRHPELVRYGAVRPRSVKWGTHARWLPPKGELSFEYDHERYGPFFYTRADVDEILAYAKARQITVVPEIEMPGHVRALLAAYPELSCRGDLPRVPLSAWSIDEEVLCVGNDQTLALLKDVLDEVCELFPEAPYIHIGGDECPRVRWKTCPKCQQRVRDAGLTDENGLQGWLVSQVVRHLKAKGRRAVGWDEVLSGDVPLSTVGMTWRRSDADGARTGYVSAGEALRRGHEMVLTPNEQCYLSRRQFATGDPHSYYTPMGTVLTLAKVYSFDPASGIPEADRSRILGGQACVWGESVPDLHDFEWKTWPRACAIAESLWCGASKPGYGDFFCRMQGHWQRLVAQGVACAPLVAPSLAPADAALTAPAFEADLSAATSNVAIVNYQGRTAVTFGTESGRSGVTFAGSGDGKSSDTLWGVKTRPFAVTGGCEYLVLVEMSGVIPVGATVPGVRLVWKAADGRELETQNALGKTEALADQVRLPVRRNDGGTVRAFTRGKVPGAAARAYLDVVVDWPNLKGGETVSVRRLAYFETPAGEPIDLGDLEAPVLELLNDSPSADFTAPLRFRLTDPSGVNWEETTFKIDGVPVALADLKRSDEVFVFAPTNRWAEDSIHRVEVACTDLKGNTGTDCGFVAFTRKKPAHPRCTVREDGMILKEGKPFFPLGWFRVRPCEGNGYDLDRGIADMKANGMNFAHTYMVRGRGLPREQELFDELVRACERHGVMLYAEPADRKLHDPKFLPLIRDNLMRGLDYRTALFWGIGDDTSWHLTPDDLKYIYRCCKAVDPEALTISADVAKGFALQIPYVPYFDLLFIESYPIREETPQDDEMAKSAACVDDAWAAVRAGGMAGRSVVAIPQAFKGWRQWKRLPTAEEVRCQAYLSIACGARGLVYYASTGQIHNVPSAKERARQPHFGPLDIPECKASFFALMRELAALEASLVLPDARRQPTVTVLKGPEKNVLGGAAVRSLLKEDGLLVVANSAHQPVTAAIRLPSGAVLTRELARNGAFSERTGE